MFHTEPKVELQCTMRRSSRFIWQHLLEGSVVRSNQFIVGLYIIFEIHAKKQQPKIRDGQRNKTEVVIMSSANKAEIRSSIVGYVLRVKIRYFNDRRTNCFWLLLLKACVSLACIGFNVLFRLMKDAISSRLSTLYATAWITRSQIQLAARRFDSCCISNGMWLLLANYIAAWIFGPLGGQSPRECHITIQRSNSRTIATNIFANFDNRPDFRR
jgi:hypothetical protein